MARVKKSGSVRRPSARKRGPATVKRKAARGGGGTKEIGRKKGGRVVKGTATTPAITFRIRELNPQEKCGRDTSVERLFRVDEVGDVPRAHLVFLDRRHGWYCEHGVSCPAIAPARRIGDSRAPHSGRTQNGGMRA